MKYSSNFLLIFVCLQICSYTWIVQGRGKGGGGRSSSCREKMLNWTLLPYLGLRIGKELNQHQHRLTRKTCKTIQKNPKAKSNGQRAYTSHRHIAFSYLFMNEAKMLNSMVRLPKIDIQIHTRFIRMNLPQTGDTIYSIWSVGVVALLC